MSRAVRLIVCCLICWALLLNAQFVSSAGPLWRDEAHSAAQAGLASWIDLWSSLQYDSFPALYPAFLRAWVSFPPLAGDRALRALGFCVGLATLVSVCLITRWLGTSRPVLVLALLAIDPVLISETCSTRPYGLGLVLLLWAYYVHWTVLVRLSSVRILGAAVLSVLAVQTSYNNAIFIAVFGLSAAAIALRSEQRKTALLVLLPGACAALSLLPYWLPLQRAQEWTALLHYRVDWLEFFEAYTKAHRAAYPLVWVSALVLAIVCVLRRFRHQAAEPVAAPAAGYALAVAAAAILCQVLFLCWMRVPPFPRYLLSPLVLSGIALQLVVGKAAASAQAILVTAAVLATGLQSWSSLGLRRTNVDDVAQVLSQKSVASDLIVLSPWFLHPSFQRYYKGEASWITVPVLPYSPITRYDLFKSAMCARDPSASIGESIGSTLRAGGQIWLVRQAIGWVPGPGDAPRAPAVPARPDGYDYVRFRSYWEREIWRRLRSCCTARETDLYISSPVWDEERLLLTRFSERQER